MNLSAENISGAAFLSRIVEAPKFAADSAGAGQLAALTGDLAGRLPELECALSDPRAARLIAGTFESSPYLTALIKRDPSVLQDILTLPPEAVFAQATADMQASMATETDVAAAKRHLRRYKSKVALLTALADLGGVWPVMTVTQVLTECADAAVSSAVRFLLRRAHEAGKWKAADPTAAEVGSGFFVLAMGKMGAYELNYSSDIDLIVFFDRERATYTGRDDVQSFFVRLTRDLVLLLEERTVDGYVFRTDLRLRPDAGATQMALSTAAAHGYYETVGQNWERAAMIKARPCAGDLQAGEEFLEELAPFVWRKYLDFAAIADVHAMKRQIHAHKEIGAITVLGQDLKLGRGGIREIEFFAQTQQLIAGGRQPDLRVRATLDALQALELRGWVKGDVRADLDAAYKYLRRLEHRLQMITDEQTHKMPDDEAGLERVAAFAGYDSGAELGVALKSVLEKVQEHYAGLFENAPKLTAKGGANLVFAGAVDDPSTLEELKRLGYSQPSQVLEIVRGWHHGRARAVRSPRARERLTEVQPLLISALADTIDPDGAIAGFDRFLSGLPVGVQLFSLLKANPNLIRLLADIMGSAPRLARILSQRSNLLDAVLDPQAIGSDVNGAYIDEMLGREFALARANNASGDPMQDILDVARVMGREQRFLVGVGLLTGAMSATDAGIAYTTIAERLVAGLMREVERDMREAHGRVAGGSAVVVALGKLGGREMTASSDLDLILIYDYEEGITQSDGAKPLAPSHYYTRLTQRLINAISARTAQGALYEVDMRLRPSGQKGPVATRLSSFKSYQAEEAWTWEHMALTRARVIAGSRTLGADVSAAIDIALRHRRERPKIAHDVIDMRARIAAEKGTSDIWDLKQTRGGLVDLEFIVQFLELVTAADKPSALDTSTIAALQALGAAGAMADSDLERLVSAGLLLNALTQMLRLCLDTPFDPATAPAGLKARLSKLTDTPTFEALEGKLKTAEANVLDAFNRLIH